MSTYTLAGGQTNPVANSVVTVVAGKYKCAITLEKNKFGDQLPIIPEAARTENNRVQYKLELRARVTRLGDGSPVTGKRVNFASSRTSDLVKVSGQTNREGEATIQVITRTGGVMQLSVTTQEVVMTPFEFSFNEAWYEAEFLITGYNVCDEKDFSGNAVSANGLSEKHKEDFLFGSSGVPMQGTGKTLSGKFVRLKWMTSKWLKNARGNPVRIEDPEKAGFNYTDGLHGAYGRVVENTSIAVDKRVIPKLGRVQIDAVGIRTADDTGSQIKLYHIDNFLGTGKAVVKSWLKGPVNGTHRRVKFLGYSE